MHARQAHQAGPNDAGSQAGQSVHGRMQVGRLPCYEAPDSETAGGSPDERLALLLPHTLRVIVPATGGVDAPARRGKHDSN